jgi:hypothetical protein
VWQSRTSLHHLFVIPGKLAIASATQNPRNPQIWMPAFASMTITGVSTFLEDLRVGHWSRQGQISRIQEIPPGYFLFLEI